MSSASRVTKEIKQSQRFISTVCFFWFSTIAMMAADEDFNIQVFDKSISFPRMVWQENLSSSKSMKDEKLFNDRVTRSDNTFIIEQIPRGQSYENWLQKYELKVVSSPDVKDLNTEFIQVIEQSIAAKAMMCPGHKQTIEVLSKTRDSQEAMVNFFCGKGPQGHGAVIVKYIRHTRDNLVIVLTQSWRGIPFKIGDTSNYPVSQNELSETETRLKKRTFIREGNANISF